MKTEINIPNETQKELKFPLLAEYKSTGKIYVFLSENFAICVSNFENHCGGGKVIPVTYEESWEILPPGTTLTLIQE